MVGEIMNMRENDDQEQDNERYNMIQSTLACITLMLNVNIPEPCEEG